MGKKEDTPLQASVKENDTLKKSIDKFIKSSDTQLKKKNIDRREVKDLHERCNDHLTEVESQIQHVTELTLEDEPSMKESKFSVKKKDELKKLSTLKVKLENLEEKLKPDETEEGEMEKEQKEDSDEEDEETEDEEESGEEEESEMVVKGGKRGQSSARSDTKIEKRKEATEEVYGESEEEDLTGDEDDDEEDDMTDVTEEEETELKKPLPRKDAKSVEKPDPHQKQQEDYDKEIVKGKKAAAVKQQVEEDDDDDETEDEEDETKDEEDETEDEEEETEDETEAVGKDDAESDEELESEEDEEVEDTSPKGTNRQYEALVDFEGEQEGDLSFHAGEILTILSARSDGWLDAKNARGKQGLVPVTYLKVYNKYKSLEKPVAEDEEEESEVDSEGGEGTKTPRSGRKLWKNIKHAVKETSVTDVLQAMGAVPAGFRESTLAKLLIEEQCSMKAYLAPKLSPSCLSYRDLFIDSTTNRVRARASRILRIVQLVSARQIPAPGVGPDNKNPRTGLDIKSRHVRVCLFDGHSMLSNIHTMAVASVDKDQRTWHFSTKMNENMKSWEFGECFIRSNTTETNIGILFELCMSYVRRSNQQVGEFSCGWVFLPLYDKDGRPAEFKSYDEFVNGGTPFEKGVDVDPNVGRRENSGMFRYLVGGNKQPRLNFRLLSPTKDQKELLDTLPDILISSTVYIQYLSFYRQILTDSVIRDNEDLLTCDNIHNGVLTTFPAVTDQSDLMDVLRQSWAERMKAVKRADKRDADLMKEQFKKVFMESVYPLVYASTLPLYKPTEPQVMQVRSAEIKRILKVNKEKKFVASLLSSDTECKPFDVSELAFSVIGPYCVAQKHRVH